MSIDRLPLNKLLELLQRSRVHRIAAIERDAKRSVIKEKFGALNGGMDFYDPFWADAKESAVNDNFDLSEATAARIDSNKQRKGLYPRLLSGFRTGWSTVKNHIKLEGPLKLVNGLTGKLFEEEDTLVRVGKLMTIRDSAGQTIISYPYFCKDVALGARHARLGLAALQQAIKPKENSSTIILDVLRGNAFSADGLTFAGTECNQLNERYIQIVHEWKVQRKMHGGS